MTAPRWPLAPLILRGAPHALVTAVALGLAAAALGPAPGPPAAPLAAAGALGAGALIARGRTAAALVVLALALATAGWAWGGARMAATAPPALALPAPVSGVVVVDATPAPDGRGGMRARAVTVALSGPRGAVPAGTRLLLDLPPSAAGAPRVGARLRVAGRLAPAAGPAAPGWWRAYLARQRIAARLRPDRLTPAGRRGGLAGLRDRWRGWAGANAAAGLEGERRALVRGMALGGGAGLSEETADAFRDTGLWHLLAVSGQNVTVVAIAAIALLRGLAVGRRPATAAAVLVILAYCLACEGGPSVARAGVVGALGLVAQLVSAPRLRWHLLLVGLAALLAVDPRAIADPGLQLSFTAVAGLLALGPPIAAWLRGWLPGVIADLAAPAAAAGLATAPVLAAHFGRLSLAGLALNVVAVPLAAPIVVLALAGLAAGALVPAAGTAAAAVAGLGAEVLLALARAGARLPGAAVDVPAWAAPVLVIPALALPLLARWLSGGEAPHRERREGRRPSAALVAGGLAVLALVWLVGRPPPPGPWPSAPTVTALDIGQGDAILLRSPDGRAALVDAGPPGAPAPVLAALRRAGVRRLDLLALTHPALDHLGGMPEVLRQVPVGLLVHPPLDPRAIPRSTRAVLDTARARGVPVRSLRAGARLSLGAWRLDVLSPARPLAPGLDPNLGTLVVMASAGSFDALLTGDAESDTLAPLAPGPVEVLKVSHHGSEDPGLTALLDELRPAAALVSAGEGNDYGHPRAETLRTLAAAGAAVWRTDVGGDLSAAPDGPGARVVAERGGGRAVD